MTEKERERHRHYANKRRYKANFGIGDFVLIAKEVCNSGQKLYLTWRGPYQVLRTERSYVFVVKDIIHESEHIVHGERIKFYA